jgi:hypothetical protein
MCAGLICKVNEVGIGANRTVVQTLPLSSGRFTLVSGGHVSAPVHSQERREGTPLLEHRREQRLNEGRVIQRHVLYLGEKLRDRIRQAIRGAVVTPVPLREANSVTKLLVRADGVQIKVEVTPVLRGCVYEAKTRSVSPKVEADFGYAEIRVVSFADLYAGKLVAALDRQYPRDLFDVHDLLANENITDELRRAFIVYLLNHNRPFAEVLDPRRLDISREFAQGFNGMTENPITIDELIQAREELIAGIVGKMPTDHRRFLISVKAGSPDWSLLDLANVDALPAVRWRLENLMKLDQRKRDTLLQSLREVLHVVE